MDSMERLTWDSEIVAGVLGKADRFLLVPLTEAGPISDEVMEDAASRGFKFVGVLAVINGHAAARCEPGMGASYTMMHASLAFAQQVADKLKDRQQGDSVDWLRRLWTLPDTRN